MRPVSTALTSGYTGGEWCIVVPRPSLFASSIIADRIRLSWSTPVPANLTPSMPLTDAQRTHSRAFSGVLGEPFGHAAPGRW